MATDFSVQIVTLEADQFLLVQRHGMHVTGAVTQPGNLLAIGQGSGLTVPLPSLALSSLPQAR
ncbi:BRCT domain-containing protein, partial [Halomonas cupida]|uniref:Uncharacterized protein n=2 Tax=Halomonas cupida TaxID=44933 RepID=A0A1M7N362_9GAMM